MEGNKVKIIQKGRYVKAIIDDVEIKCLTAVEYQADIESPPYISLKFYPSEVEVNIE